MPAYSYRVIRRGPWWKRLFLKTLNWLFGLKTEIHKIDEVVVLHLSILDKQKMETDGKIVLNDGAVGERDIVMDHSQFQDTPGCWSTGLYSDAAGVLPEQAREAYEHSVQIGVPTQFCPETGCAIFRDRSHRKNYLKVMGMVDKNGGYGDPT